MTSSVQDTSVGVVASTLAATNDRLARLADRGKVGAKVQSTTTVRPVVAEKTATPVVEQPRLFPQVRQSAVPAMEQNLRQRTSARAEIDLLRQPPLSQEIAAGPSPPIPSARRGSRRSLTRGGQVTQRE